MSLQPPLFPIESDWRPPSLADLPTNWGKGRVAIDTETCDPLLMKLGPGVRRGGYMVGVSFKIEGDRSYYLPIRHLGGDNLPCANVLWYLKDMAAKFTGEIVGANFQYDLDYLAQEGIVFPVVRAVRDIQIADPVLYELHNSYSLQNVLTRWGFEGKDESVLRDAAKHYGVDPKGEMWKLPARFVGPYAEGDVDDLCELIAKQEQEIDRQGLRTIYDLESALTPVLLKMRRRGVAVNQGKLDEIESWAEAQERAAVKRITDLTGVSLGVGDVNKKPPLVRVMDSLGVTLKQTATGQPQIDKEFLAQLDHPAADAINYARKMNKLRNTFVKSVRSHMVDGRIHCTFNQMRRTRETGDEAGAKYGRLSCSDPNLQQQPARDDFASMWRAIYVPDEGLPLWMSADYSQQEPRMLVHFAELIGLDKAQEAAERYRRDPDTDNHAMMTQLVYPGLAMSDPTWKKRRGECKQIFLGLCYGMGGGKLARSIGLPTKMARGSKGPYEAAGPEAQGIFDRFDSAVPFVRKLAWRCERRAKQRGYIQTLLGRRCRFPASPNGMGYDWTHKALNRLIQGSSADQTKRAMIEIDKAGLPLQLQVHDEVCAGVASVEVAREVAEIMRTCVQIRVPSKVDIESGPSWGDAKEI